MNDNSEITTPDQPKEEKPMEVHHHPHLDHHKKWITYVFEFLMIFLAVTAGFMAENYREQLKDKEQIHKYVKSMIADLRSDIIMFDSTMKENITCREVIDKFIPLLRSKSEDTSELYHLARRATTINDWYSPNTKTFDQLKSSGGLRLIEKENILDSITSYYQSLKWFDVEGNLLDNSLKQIFISNEKLFDAAVFHKMVKTVKGGFYSFDYDKPNYNPPLLSNDPIVVNSVIMSYHVLYSVLFVMERPAQQSRENSKRLVKLLEKEYEVSNTGE